jgi:rod shape determining protein RodA
LTTITPTRRTPGVLERVREAALGVDWLLLGAVGAILALSLYVIRAATREDIPGAPEYFFNRQVLYVAAGLVLMAVCSRLDLAALARWHWAIWGGLLGALAVVFVIAPSIRGTRSWIEIGPFNLQPSEFGKIALMIVLAGLVVSAGQAVQTWRFTLLATGVAALPALIVFVQPDLGTSLVYFVILVATLFVAGTPWHHLAVFAAIIVTVVAGVLWILPAAGVEVLKPYQTERLTSFVGGTSDDPGGASYQQDQSTVAVGSGGALGKGPDGATQTINDFLPEHHTDFIFAVTGEMLGFVGAGGLLLLYGLVLWRGVRTTALASNRVDQLVGASVVAVIGFQVFINIGMNVGLMPITGLPLPYMSFGGSHTATMLACIGLLIGIHQRRSALST